MIARPPSIGCPSCGARPVSWCNFEDGSVCVVRQIRMTSAAHVRDSIAEAARLRAEVRRQRIADIRAASFRAKGDR